ncbi:M56 family metallopeptidase [Mucilaginibacter auburnensis]|uniref:Beta-lactamase regulating signal transducer with metallopeptidase domain n=1 Tax=Mucilaginibacter auburnensis TaxID=1457233 RepID=A0A2H9VVF3_9SPHI|nr:M56 family metallopeptidase [Mucilaginibacter auburnensis]PJJ84795.1 beta-lactamase regulating signal transducer with metallopeptidase domain [Mucilaginibacter auburnensis]
MNAVVYLFQVSACMGIFYLFYYALLSRFTFFTINRWYLLITMALSFVIPLLTITVQQNEAYPEIIQKVVYVNQLQTVAEPLKISAAPAVSERVSTPLNWMEVLTTLYKLSVFALSARLIIIVVRFLSKMRNKKRTKVDGVQIVTGDKTLNNGSFFNYIFLNSDELTADELQQIIAHEMLHVKLLHSVDRILVKIAQVFLWFNPFVYLYAQAIEQNHEFEVDREVGNSTNRHKYAELLLHLSVASGGSLYHNFSMVPLKKRITMLFTKPTHKMKKVIYLLTVPVVLISCLAFAKLKSDDSTYRKVKIEAATDNSDTSKVQYRQKSKLTPAQRKANDEGRRKALAYMESAEGKKKMEQSRAVWGKEITVAVLNDYNNEKGLFRGRLVKEKNTGAEFLLPSWYGQSKKLNTQIKQGDELTIKVFSGGVNQESPVIITPAYVIKNGKKIFQLAEADKIPDYPFLFEANKVRFADGQITRITKYPNGKWKTAVFERVNGYKFNLSFKPNAPDLNGIADGDHVTLRFVHEVKTGAKAYKIADWVAISPDIKDYGIKNPDFFFKFYEVKTDKSDVLKGQRSGSNNLNSIKPTTIGNVTEPVNNPVDSELPDNVIDSMVKAKFGGKVSIVRDILGTKLVIIRNGEYFAGYANLKTVNNIKEGDEIAEGQVLGKAGIDMDNNIAWSFELYHGQQRVTREEEQQAIINSLASPKFNFRIKYNDGVFSLASTR